MTFEYTMMSQLIKENFLKGIAQHCSALLIVKREFLLGNIALDCINIYTHRKLLSWIQKF